MPVALAFLHSGVYVCVQWFKVLLFSPMLFLASSMSHVEAGGLPQCQVSVAGLHKQASQSDAVCRHVGDTHASRVPPALNSTWRMTERLSVSTVITADVALGIKCAPQAVTVDAEAQDLDRGRLRLEPACEFVRR